MRAPSVAFAVRRGLRRRLHGSRLRLTSLPIVAHAGIQRSGTNYLNHILRDSDLFVANAVDPERDHPSHKHFRWQDNKNSIVMDRAFMNDCAAGSIFEVNRIAGFPLETKHVVVFKKPENWLQSIYRWGLTHDWVSGEEDFLRDPQLAAAWLGEWDEYHKKWGDLESVSPEMVLIVCYEDLLQDSVKGVSSILEFLVGESSHRQSTGDVDKVPHSRRRAHEDRREPLVASEVLGLIQRVVSWDWERRCWS